MQLGMMFWAGRDTFDDVLGVGVRCGQLGIGGDVALTPEFREQWKANMAREQFSIAAVVCAYAGESYADLATVERTVGFIPAATRAERERRTLEASDFAASLGVSGIGCHIGFVPADRAHPDYQAVLGMTRRICDHAAGHGQTFALETGQEPARLLLRFIEDAGRGNLKINFDPANMILYGTGDPIEALEILAPHVVSVHAKDGDWPAAAGQLGVERPLGAGAVGIPRLIETLKRSGFAGGIHVEHEIPDRARRLAEIREAVALLRGLI